ncbi:MAG: hypothetical protein KDD55_06810 [Bdellovibrionales bacterium]|nr:hypothetical protein [Bdellovibrionales bacterium]
MFEQQQAHHRVPLPSQPASVTSRQSESPLASASLPGMSSIEERQAVESGVSTGRSTEFDTLRVETNTEPGQGSGVISSVRRGFTSINTLRVMNLGLAGVLCGIHAAAGQPVLAALWGVAATCWGVSLFLGNRDGSRKGDESPS